MLLNKSKIAITILGSGTGFPSLRRSSCALLMETGNKKLLFDCGPGTIRRLLEAGKTIFEIPFIFISHLHPDHTSELVPFLFGNKYSDRNRRKLPLTIVAAKGFAVYVEKLYMIYGHWIALEPGMLNIIEMDNKAYDIHWFDGFSVESMPVDHIQGSIAYRISTPGKASVVYSGDTDFSENLITLSTDADLLICESAFPDKLKTQGHLTPSLAGEIATRAHVKKMVLIHFYPECDNIDIKGECRKTYKGHLAIAEDLMKLEVPDPL